MIYTPRSAAPLDNGRYSGTSICWMPFFRKNTLNCGYLSGPPVRATTDPFLLFAQILLGSAAPTRIRNGATCVTTARLYSLRAKTAALPSTSSALAYIRSSTYAAHFSGHVSGPPANTMTNSLLLFAQVSNNSSTIKTSNHCLVLLACPKSICAVFLYIEGTLLPLLMLCGHVEDRTLRSYCGNF